MTISYYLKWFGLFCGMLSLGSVIEAQGREKEGKYGWTDIFVNLINILVWAILVLGW